MLSLMFSMFEIAAGTVRASRGEDGAAGVGFKVGEAWGVECRALSAEVRVQRLECRGSSVEARV
jgi:hypothetical protein